MPTVTSLESYRTSDFEPKERLIFNTLKQVGRLTRPAIAGLTGLSINCVCGRVRAMLDADILEVCGSALNEVTGKHNEVVRIVERKVAA